MGNKHIKINSIFEDKSKVRTAAFWNLTGAPIDISSLIPMFNLTIEGIEEAMNYLRNSGKNQFTTVHRLKGLNY